MGTHLACPVHVHFIVFVHPTTAPSVSTCCNEYYRTATLTVSRPLKARGVEGSSGCCDKSYRVDLHVIAYTVYIYLQLVPQISRPCVHILHHASTRAGDDNELLACISCEAVSCI
jgi:hypothetical protein